MNQHVHLAVKPKANLLRPGDSPPVVGPKSYYFLRNVQNTIEYFIFRIRVICKSQKFFGNIWFCRVWCCKESKANNGLCLALFCAGLQRYRPGDQGTSSGNKLTAQRPLKVRLWLSLDQESTFTEWPTAKLKLMMLVALLGLSFSVFRLTETFCDTALGIFSIAFYIALNSIMWSTSSFIKNFLMPLHF